MNDLQISILGYTFSQLVLNIQAQANGTVTFSDNFADLPVTLSLAANGNNFFTITGGDFDFIRLDSSDAQFQIGHGRGATFVTVAILRRRHSL
jgi:hypothetical protein